MALSKSERSDRAQDRRDKRQREVAREWQRRIEAAPRVEVVTVYNARTGSYDVTIRGGQ